MKRFASNAAWSVPWLIFLAIGLTVVPAGAQPADSGEFQLVARDLGVAHPPGYPLYTLSAHLFGRLVLAIPPLRHLGWPWAVNAFSMVLAVVTLFVVARTATRLGGSWLGGAIAAALLAFAPTFAAQALVANIRMATGLFAAVVLSLALDVVSHGGPLSPTEDSPHPPTPSPKFGGGGGSRVGGGRGIVALCFVGALAAGHHPTLAALALPLGLAILVRRPAVLRDRRALPRLAAMCVAAALIGLLPLLYLPIRAAQHAPLAPADLASWGGVWRHVTAAGFRGDMLAITGARDLGDRLLVLGNILQLQFGPLALVLMVVGAAWLIARRRAEAVALLGTALVVGWLAITYRAPQTMEYLLPAYVALAIVAGGGAELLGNRLRSLPRPIAAVALLAFAAAYPNLFPLDGQSEVLALEAVPDLSAITRLASDAACLPANATVLTNWHYATPLWLAGRRAPNTVDFEGDAPYVTLAGAPVVYVHPDFATGDPIGETWRKRAASAAGDGPVLLTNRTSELLAADAPVTPEIVGPFWWRSNRPAPRLACAQHSLAFVWSPMVADVGTPPDELSLGDGFVEWGDASINVRLTAGAGPTVKTEGIVAFAQLVDRTSGEVVGQADRPLGSPEVQIDGRHTFAVRLPVTPFRAFVSWRDLAIDVGLYRSGPSGAARLPVRNVRFDLQGRPGTEFPFLPPAGDQVIDGTAARLLVLAPLFPILMRYEQPAPPHGSVPFGSAMSLLHSTIHRTPTALLVDLTWRADPLASLSDYTVSVQAAADDASWRAQHDGTPALGAIPTLKWLPGMIIHDRHRIPLPPEAAGHDGPFTVTVGVYDAFSLEPLPVTDGDLVRAGQGQRAILHPTP